MIKPLLKSLVMVGTWLPLSYLHATELMKWERLPLAIPLQVGQERVVFVDRNVRVGVPGSLTGKLRVQSTGGSLYLLASEPIAPTRIQLQDAENGALILLDIAASVPGRGAPPLEPVQIIEGSHAPVKYGQQADSQTTAEPPTLTTKNTETPIPVILTRYAAQNLYAPLRTVEPVTGIRRVNLNRALNLQTLLPTLPVVNARAMTAWQLEDYWVSAVLLKNTSRQIVPLDPRVLQGNFVTATFQHPDLGKAGDASDTTVVYLVTRHHNLAESILPAISQINAAGNKGGGPNEK